MGKKLLIFLVILFAAQKSFSNETTGGSTPLQITITPSQEQIALTRLPEYPPRCERFIEPDNWDYTQVDACAHPEWVPTLECPNQDQVRRANILMGMAETIIEAHNYRFATQNGSEGFTYEARTLVCKMFRESTFRPQAEAPGDRSSAAGLSMVTRSTAQALMDKEDRYSQALNFYSRLPRYNHIEDGDELYEAMRGSIALQIEVGLAVLQLKNLEGRSSIHGVRELLERYYGHGLPASPGYAARIIDCSRCIRDNNNEVQYSCLLKSQDSTKDGQCP